MRSAPLSELLLWLAEDETKWGSDEVTLIDFAICHGNFVDSLAFDWTSYISCFQKPEDTVWT